MGKIVQQLTYAANDTGKHDNNNTDVELSTAQTSDDGKRHLATDGKKSNNKEKHAHKRYNALNSDINTRTCNKRNNNKNGADITYLFQTLV